MPTCDTVCGTGSWSGPLPGDPDNNSALSAVAGYGGIEVSWTYPTVNPAAVAHVQLFRAITSNFEGALQIATVNGDRYFDKHETGTTYYYWIRIVSVNATVGERIGPASAAALPRIQDMITLLTGQIDAGLLATTLRNEIDAIPTNRADLDQEIADRIAADEIIELSLSDTQDGVAESLAFIAAETTARTDADSALATAIDTVGVAFGDDLALVETTLQANIDTVDGEVTAIGALYHTRVTVNGLVGGFGIYNDGSTVEAGFDVDTFWVGRTSADKRKPFIISGGVVYIDQGCINELTFTKLKDESGSFIVSGGKVQAAYLKVETASIDNLAVTTAKMDNLAVTSAKIGAAAVETLKIAGNAVTVPVVTSPGGSIFGNGAYQSIMSTYVTLAEAGVLFASCAIIQGFAAGAKIWGFQLQIAGTVAFDTGAVGPTNEVSLAGSGAVAVAAGTHLVEVLWYGQDATIGVGNRTLFAMGAMR